jgi:beta-1,4-mannosyltransferase
MEVRDGTEAAGTIHAMERDPRPVRVTFYPPARRDEPANFVSMLARAVDDAGAQMVRIGPLRLRWCVNPSPLVDVVHLHWLEYAAAADPTPGLGWWRTWFRLGRLTAEIIALRARGAGVVWTIHNLNPHEPVRPREQRLLARTVYRLADEIIVHSEHARESVLETFGRRRNRPLHVIPHGNLAFGVIRRYKRLGLLAEQFRDLAGEELRLLVAGTPSEAGELETLERHASADPRILLRPEFVPDDAVRGLHLAADAGVLAYADVFSSGALLLALSCGVPVVAPALGTARELFSPPAVEFFERGEIASALQRIRVGDRATAAREAAERFDWGGVGVATVAIYRSALRRR